MLTRFKKRAKIFDIVITAVGGTLSVGVMLYGVFHFGLGEAWPELVLNLFYIACLAMTGCTSSIGLTPSVSTTGAPSQ